MSVPRSTLLPRDSMHVLFVIILLIGLAACELGHKTIELPRWRSSFSMVQYDNKIYMPGGYLSPSAPTNTIEILNIDSLEWEEPLLMPEERAVVTPILVGSRLVLAGGLKDGTRFQHWNPYYKTVVEFGRLPTVRNNGEGSFHFKTKSIFIDNAGFIDIFDHSTLSWDNTQDLLELTQTVGVQLVKVVDDQIWIVRARSAWLDPLQYVWSYNVTSKNVFNYSAPVFPLNDEIRITRCGNGFVLFWTSRGVLGALNPATADWNNITLEIGSISAVNSIGSLVLIDNGLEMQIHSFEIPSLNGVQILFDNQTAYRTSFTLQDKVVYVMPSGEWIVFNSTLAKTIQSPGALGTVISSFKWKEDLQLLADLSNLITYSSTSDSINIVPTSGLGSGNIRGVFKHNDDIAVVKSDAILFYNQQLDLIDNVPRAPTSAVPIGIVGDDLFYISGCSVLLNFTQEITCDFSGGAYSVAENGVAFGFKGNPIPKTDLNIYDFDTKNWSLVIPQSPFEQFTSFFYAYGVPNNHTIWFHSRTFANQLRAYNLLNESWSTIELIENVVLGDARGAEFPVIDGLMYLPVLNISFLTVNVSSMEQQITPSKDQALRGTRIRQIISNHRDIIALTVNMALSVECYNITSQTWFSYEVSEHSQHALAFRDNTLLLRGNGVYGEDNTMVTMDLLDTQQRTTSLSGFIKAFDMASISTTNFTLFAGGITPSSRSIRTVDIFYIVPPETPQVTTEPEPDPPSSGVPVAAIVAPIVCGVALIAGGLLAFFLIRRKKKQRREEEELTPVTTIGLASLNGSSFFTPYTEIKFGEIIGSGASGQVFVGKWKNTKVALKMSMTQATETLIREIRLMIELRPHPNIVQILGYTVHPETSNIILILEYCDGGSLDALLFDKHTSPPMSQKIEWIKAICNGVLHLHSNNIVHRDLAARNILLSHNEAKITDFGMSRLVGSENSKGTTTSELGPIRWMAPEAIRSKQYSTKSGTGFVLKNLMNVRR